MKHDWKLHILDSGTFGMYGIFQCNRCDAISSADPDFGNKPGRPPKIINEKLYYDQFLGCGCAINLPDDCDLAIVKAHAHLRDDCPACGK